MQNFSVYLVRWIEFIFSGLVEVVAFYFQSLKMSFNR